VDVASFIEATIGGLLAHDQRRNGELTQTLLAYLEHTHNAKATADFLKIHVNTLRQRLEAVDAILGNWRAGGRSLEVHVALRMNNLRKRIASLDFAGTAPSIP
jgi:sugar diacid utilization regulator